MVHSFAMKGWLDRNFIPDREKILHGDVDAAEYSTRRHSDDRPSNVEPVLMYREFHKHKNAASRKRSSAIGINL